MCIGSAALYLLGRPQATVAKSETPQEALPPQREAKFLVPELVPFVSESDRARIRELYMSAPDYKAMALNTVDMTYVTAQPDQDTANRAAVTACQKITDQRQLAGQGTSSSCDLYASGNLVVTSGGYPPMPPTPWVIRDPSIERPFVAADIPLVSAAAKERAEKNYRALPKSKIYVVAPGGNPTVYYGEPNTEQASRRALERCGYLAGIACMIIAIDDMFVVPVPTLTKVIGFYRPDAFTAVAPELRDDIARRLGNATTGWNAVAVGVSGRAGIKLGAESEQAAIAGATDACSRQDRNCRIAVIGPFLVERGP